MDVLKMNLQNLLGFISRRIHTFVRQYDAAFNPEYSVCERHNLFTESPLSEDDFLISILSSEEYHQDIQKTFGDIIFENQENHTHHNPYEQEIREMDSIRNDDAERLKQSWEEDYTGVFGILGPTQLRSYQNLGITITILASRAAIESGVHAESTVPRYH